MCERSGAARWPETRAMLTDLLTLMLTQADPEQRARLVDRLAQAAWTPRAVALQLTQEPLTEPGLSALARRAETDPGLRIAVARHRGLTREQAETLAPHASGPLRRALETRFGLTLAPTNIEPESDAGQTALIDKLHTAGRLGPGAVLRLLREGRGAAFRAGLATLSGTTLDAVEAACSADDPRALSALCVRAGFDRAVLAEVVALAVAKA